MGTGSNRSAGSNKLSSWSRYHPVLPAGRVVIHLAPSSNQRGVYGAWKCPSRGGNPTVWFTGFSWSPWHACGLLHQQHMITSGLWQPLLSGVLGHLWTLPGASGPLPRVSSLRPFLISLSLCRQRPPLFIYGALECAQCRMHIGCQCISGSFFPFALSSALYMLLQFCFLGLIFPEGKA